MTGDGASAAVTLSVNWKVTHGGPSTCVKHEKCTWKIPHLCDELWPTLGKSVSSRGTKLVLYVWWHCPPQPGRYCFSTKEVHYLSIQNCIKRGDGGTYSGNPGLNTKKEHKTGDKILWLAIQKKGKTMLATATPAIA